MCLAAPRPTTCKCVRPVAREIDNSFFPVNISGKQNDALVNTTYTDIADLSHKALDDRGLNQ